MRIKNLLLFLTMLFLFMPFVKATNVVYLSNGVYHPFTNSYNWINDTKYELGGNVTLDCDNHIVDITDVLDTFIIFRGDDCIVRDCHFMNNDTSRNHPLFDDDITGLVDNILIENVVYNTEASMFFYTSGNITNLVMRNIVMNADYLSLNVNNWNAIFSRCCGSIQNTYLENLTFENVTMYMFDNSDSSFHFGEAENNLIIKNVVIKNSPKLEGNLVLVPAYNIRVYDNYFDNGFITFNANDFSNVLIDTNISIYDNTFNYTGTSNPVINFYDCSGCSFKPDDEPFVGNLHFYNNKVTYDAGLGAFSTISIRNINGNIFIENNNFDGTRRCIFVQEGEKSASELYSNYSLNLTINNNSMYCFERGFNYYEYDFADGNREILNKGSLLITNNNIIINANFDVSFYFYILRNGADGYTLFQNNYFVLNPVEEITYSYLGSAYWNSFNENNRFDFKDNYVYSNISSLNLTLSWEQLKSMDFSGNYFDGYRQDLIFGYSEFNTEIDNADFYENTFKNVYFTFGNSSDNNELWSNEFYDSYILNEGSNNDFCPQEAPNYFNKYYNTIKVNVNECKIKPLIDLSKIIAVVLLVVVLSYAIITGHLDLKIILSFIFLLIMVIVFLQMLG